jgi:cytochrome P450
MTVRLAISNLGAFHQTSIAITNVIFNVLASDAEYKTIAVLREEIKSVVGEKGEWTKAAVAKMVKCDSVCKETLRIHSFGNRSPMRKVMVDNLKTEDGILLPKGAMISLLLTSQVDEEFFPDPLKFKPFRYSDMRENGEGAGVSFVALGEKFLPFGYGRHACPGRFLLDFELKMILSYMLTNYDVELAPEHNGVRPESKWVAEAIMPPFEGKIRIKRRRT